MIVPIGAAQEISSLSYGLIVNVIMGPGNVSRKDVNAHFCNQLDMRYSFQAWSLMHNIS